MDWRGDYELEIGVGRFGDVGAIGSEAMAFELVNEMAYIGRQALGLRALRH